MTLSKPFRSATDRAMGPTLDKVSIGPAGQAGTPPKLAFMPVTPQKLAGIRVDPPPSVPICSVPIPAASAVAAPPLLPPLVRLKSQILRVTPVKGLSAVPFQPN